MTGRNQRWISGVAHVVALHGVPVVVSSNLIAPTNEKRLAPCKPFFFRNERAKEGPPSNDVSWRPWVCQAKPGWSCELKGVYPVNYPFNR